MIYNYVRLNSSGDTVFVCADAAPPGTVLDTSGAVLLAPSGVTFVSGADAAAYQASPSTHRWNGAVLEVYPAPVP